MQRSEHHFLLIWLIFTGLVVFGLVLCWHQGLLERLFTGDRSRISWAIAFLYLLAMVHCALHTVRVSAQINLTDAIERMILQQGQPLRLSLSAGRVRLNGETVLPDSFVSRYIGDLLQAVSSARSAEERALTRTDLMDVYSSKVRGPHEMGWFVVDILIKLGLLGTIVGFILMLASVATTETFDVSTMQRILSQMSSGMGTALYTTLAGLSGSLLLAVQYHFLDRGADDLIERTAHLSEVHILPSVAVTG